MEKRKDPYKDIKGQGSWAAASKNNGMGRLLNVRGAGGRGGVGAGAGAWTSNDITADGQWKQAGSKISQ